MIADIAEETGETDAGYGVITFRDVDYPILRKPSSLLLAELARTQSGDPEALGTLADFFESTLGKDTYRAFKRNVFATEVEQAELLGYLNEIVEKTLGRPTE